MTSQALDYDYPEFYDSAALEGGEAISYPKYYNDAALIGGFTTANTTLNSMFGKKIFKKGEAPEDLTPAIIKKAKDIYNGLRPGAKDILLRKAGGDESKCIKAIAIVYLMESISKQSLYYSARDNKKMQKTVTNRKLALGRYIRAHDLSDLYNTVRKFFVPRKSAPHALPKKVRGIADMFERGKFEPATDAFRHKTGRRNVKILREILNSGKNKSRYSNASLLAYLGKSSDPGLREYMEEIILNRKLKRNEAAKLRRERNKRATSSKSPRKSIARKAPRKSPVANKTTGGKVLLLNRTPYSYFQ